MAEGRGRAGAGWLVAGALVLTILVSTGVWNPFPGIWERISTSRPLSDPQTLWQQRLGGVPKSVTILDAHIVIEHRESVEVRSRANGARLWQQSADWAAVAGNKIVTGKLLVKGYQVRDIETGNVIWPDDRAAGVWTFANGMVDASCRTSQDCQLTARDLDTGHELWKVGLPGIGFVLFADNPRLADADQMYAVQTAMPPLLGFPVDGRVHVVDTRKGRVLKPIEPERDTRVHVMAGKLIYSTAKSVNGRCLSTVVGREAVGGTEAWRRDGYSVVSLDGAGCEPRGEPTAGGNAVMAVQPDGRQVLLDAGDGREVLVCADGERVLGTDGIYAVVRTADGTKLVGYALGNPRPLWTREAAPDASVAVNRTGVVVSDHTPDRIIVLDPISGNVRTEVRSGADVVGFDATGVVLGERRELGYLALG